MPPEQKGHRSQEKKFTYKVFLQQIEWLHDNLPNAILPNANLPNTNLPNAL